MPGQQEFSLPDLPAVDCAIILGSGLGAFADGVHMEKRIPYHEIAGLPASTVPGHAGELMIGTLGNLRWAVFRGRIHLYEGRTAREATALVRLAAQLGTKTLILTNAAGSLNSQFHPGNWMQISDHLNLTGTSPLEGGPNFVDMTEVYDTALRRDFADLARTRQWDLPSGTYAGLRGPQYETPAEIRMLQKLGADAVGMSTVLEAIQARALGLKVAGFSCLTNWGAGLAAGTLNHHEVLETGQAAAARLCALLQNWASK